MWQVILYLFSLALLCACCIGFGHARGWRKGYDRGWSDGRMFPAVEGGDDATRPA